MLTGDLTDNPYAFTGQRLDPESNLYHFHFRQYDAEVGVWTTADPIGVIGGVNLYQYVNSNPINHADFLGLTGGEESEDNESNDTGDYDDAPSTSEEDTEEEEDKGFFGNLVDKLGDIKQQISNAVSTVGEAIKGFFGGAKGPKSNTGLVVGLGNAAFEVEKEQYKAMKRGYEQWRQCQQPGAQDNPACDDRLPGYLPNTNWENKNWENLGGGVDVKFEDLNWDKAFN
ncbi:RHS repeat-associated core domain-containing protein [Desulfopila sp. IMCC35008]|uniref:RHS repeat-associated core domain-containing protein n=1 Tax=Desulfopila sp. IMCC35008 TaxID=2653858 RepID=UPI0013D7149F|nr:RHS repeat-associated core domain-containing protein [Desulfopila sp. IMCC35008]